MESSISDRADFKYFLCKVEKPIPRAEVQRRG